MATQVELTPRFERLLERLARAYPRIEDELETLISQLEQDQRPGDKIPRVGYDVYKVRLRNPSAGRGKRGGFRVVYYIRHKDKILLIMVYSKTERGDIAAEEIRRLIDEYEK